MSLLCHQLHSHSDLLIEFQYLELSEEYPNSLSQNILNILTSTMAKTRAHQVRRMAVSPSSSTESPDVQSRPSSRTSLRFVQDSLQKIYPSHVTSRSQIQNLQKALDDAKILNAKHQEQIETLTLDRDAALDDAKILNAKHQKQIELLKLERDAAVDDAKIFNAEYQEKIETLTLERDAAESELHTNKRLWHSQEEDFCHSETSLDKTRALLQAALRQNEAQQMALGAKNKELGAKDKEIERFQRESSNQSSEIVSLTNEKMDLEDWISEIKARVKEANAYHSNVESKVHTQNGIILQLKAENTRLEHLHERDTINLEMNKKALVRSNMDLKRSCEDLQGKLQAEQEKAKAMEPTIDWKAECLKVHKRKNMEMHVLASQIEHLQVENQEQYMELRELRAAEPSIAAQTKLVNAISPTTVGSAPKEEPTPSVASNSTSSIVTMFDVSPSKVMNDSSAVITSLQPAETWKSRISPDLAGVIVFLGCLLSAVWILGNF